jgi:hypothetical protein
MFKIETHEKITQCMRAIKLAIKDVLTAKVKKCFIE